MNTSPRRRWLVVGGIAATAAVAASVLTVATSSSDSIPEGSSPPGGVVVQNDGTAGELIKTVRGYYAAVRAGDASKALSYGAPVGDTRLLTDAALRAQQAIGRIEKVTVDPDVLVVKDHALVDIVMVVGGKKYDDLVRVPKVKGRYAFPVATVLSAEDSPYELLGQTIAAKAEAYVFPGPLRPTSKNPYVAISDDTEVVAGTGAASPFLDRKATLNATGKIAILAAVGRAMATCAASRTLRPSDIDCPNSTIDTSGGELIANSVRWTAPTDLTPLEIDDDLALGYDRVSVSGTVTFGVTYQVKVGKTVRTMRESVPSRLFGNADLTTSPPTYEG